MKRYLRFSPVILAALALAVGGSTMFLQQASAQKGGAQGGVQKGDPQKGGAKDGATLSVEAQEQISALLAEKYARTPEESKIGFHLLNAMRAQRGQAMTRNGKVRVLNSAMPMAQPDQDGRVEVNIKGEVTKQLAMTIEKLQGEVRNASVTAGVIRALVPLSSLMELAGNPAVRSIRPAKMQAATRRQLTGPTGTARPIGMNGVRPNLNQRAMNVRANLTAALAKAGVAAKAQDQTTNTGSVTSQGDTAHNAAAARNFFGVNGAGVKIGVLSDSVDFLAQSIASGNLPADVTVLPGQSGVPGSGEGTAMLEIVHDVAPGAKLFFATAFTSIESFADNIRALRAAGCDIIVDDIIYFVESPFHDDIVSTAVNEVTADGALYFSSAGNEGNLNDGTSGTWEGDFKNSRVTLPGLTGGTLHDFGDGVISNFVEIGGFVTTLHWSDPLGASGNDYDFFILNNQLTAVIDASIEIQDGDDDPFEITFGAPGGSRILIFKADSAARRAIHLNNFRGELGLATTGTIRGHAAAANAFAVAAVNAALAGGGSFTGGPTNPVELFSADGNRRIFYKSDGSPITPGKVLFSNNGGEVRKKPEVSAADGTATSVPGFGTFFGTSAAAPHAAAIAALVKSAKPRLAPNRIKRALTRTALDIEAVGVDRDSGAGIVDAFGALLDVGAAPSPSVVIGAATTTAVGGDGDTFIEPGEGGTITVALTNVGGATALGVSATLSTSTPGVTITSATSNYPNIGSNGQSANNVTPFAFTLANTATCGAVINFTLTVNVSNSNDGPQTSTFSVQTGQPNITVASYTGPPVFVDPNIASTVTIPLVVSGLSGPVGDLNFSFDGTSCTSATGATTVGFDHSWVGDLRITLTSPQGTTVTLMDQPGGPLNSGNNFCNTLLDDGATALIQAITPVGAPWTGAFKPASSLAAFSGQNGNGTWTLTVSDLVPLDGGNVRAFSLSFTSFVCSSSLASAGVGK